jgi:hypothetical protein
MGNKKGLIVPVLMEKERARELKDPAASSTREN